MVRTKSAAVRHHRTSAGVLSVGLGILVLLSLAIGSRNLTPGELWQGLTSLDTSRESIIVWQLRAPRTALAILVGGALAVSGVVMQALTRNPLAEPGLLGVNAGASFAVVLAICLLGATTISDYLWFALLGSGLAAGFVYVISVRRSHSGDHARLVLAGAGLTASLGACTGITTMFDTDSFSSYRFWVIGSVADRGTEPLLHIVPFLLIGSAAAFLSGPSLNVLALGEEQAAALGVRLPTVRVLAFAAITVLSAAATAAAGPVSFVGLVVPHVLRLLVGTDQRALLVLSVIAGPVLVLGADIIGRVVTPPGELEVGIVTAFLGAPILITLIRDRRYR